MEADEFNLVLLHIYVGVAWMVGCFLFGLIVIQKNQECRVSQQYLCQVINKHYITCVTQLPIYLRRPALKILDGKYRLWDLNRRSHRR